MGRESAACRVCMKKSKDSVELEAIFVRKPRITYLEGYNICTQLNALIGDGLPKNLCTHCRDELRAAFRFMEKAKETDKKLREKLGVHRVTRSSRRIKQEESVTKATQPALDAETSFEEIKTEFINCSRDPLEDSDVEADEKSEDEIEMSWLADGRNEMETDGFAIGKTATIVDEDDDDDDKPLKELIKKEKLKPIVEEPAKTNPNFDSSDVFNDFQEPDNYSSDDDGAFDDKMVEHMPEAPTTPEAQIFPQGRYMCKICQKTYFTAAGLKAHIAVHMAKKKKVKRVRGPNKKKGKNKKKAGDADEDDDDEGGGENKNEDNSDSKNKVATATADDKDDSTATKGEGIETGEANVTDGKKKRKSKMPKPKKMFPCHVCGKHMISASKLRYHMVMHTGEKDYLCTMCPKAYSTIYALKHHMRTHTGERPYECKFCGDKFTRPTTLKSHMRRHTGERPYGCDICGKRFIQHSSMTTHMKLNHMAKTIACPHCDKKYARQTDLNTHLLSHTGDKPFSCELCPSRFIRQANLNKHMNQHHSEKSKAAAAAAAAAVAAATANTQIAGQSIQNQDHPALPRTINTVTNQGGGQLVQQQRQNSNHPSMARMINTPVSVTTANQIAVQSLQQQRQTQLDQGPLPRVVHVRSLAKPVPTAAATTTGVHLTATPPGSVGNDESNSSNHSNHMPPPPSRPPSSQQQHQQHHQQQQQQQQQQQLQTHMQQSNMGPPHSANNENSIPMSMNISEIPTGIPTHNMLGGGGGAHITALGRLESIEHLKVIHPPVDNLTNLLGQVIDPERMGRSVDDIIRWNWPNAS